MTHDRMRFQRFTAILANRALRGTQIRHTAPRLSMKSPLETLIGWLCCVDGTACWSEEDSKAQGLVPLTEEEAWDAIAAEATYRTPHVFRRLTTYDVDDISRAVVETRGGVIIEARGGN